MNLFDYIRPASVAEAIEAASEPGAAYLGAGTNLLDLMKIGVQRPGRLVDVTRLAGLDRIEWLADGGVRIGAMVRNSDLARDPAFATAYPVVAEALLSGASPQLRNMATVGGNLMQRTRCAYFQDTASACNRREPGSGCDARHGENRTHAVLGWSDACIATHPSDFCVPLVALDAVVEIEGRYGLREVPLEQFHPLPGSTPERISVLEAGELIVALRLPPEAAGFRSHARYLKLRERTSFAFALVSAAAALQIEDGTIRAARLALGGVAAKPWRARNAETLLEGAAPTPEIFAQAAEVALADALPSGDNAYKIDLAKRVVKRALLLAATGTPDRMPALPASAFSSDTGAHAHA
ncbi:FAD binding domain-containing protein [Mesorhizobium sp. A623]